jgi:PmbA protein
MMAVVDEVLHHASRKADRAEVLFNEYETTRVHFKAGALHQAAIVDGRGVGLRTFVEGRVGYASTTDFDKIDELLENALAAARYGREAEYELPNGAADYREVNTYDEAAAKISPREMVDVGEQAVEKTTGTGGRYVVDVEVDRVVGRTRLVNTAGFDRTQDRTSYDFAVIVQRTAEDDIFYHYDYDASFARDFDEMAIVQRLLETLAWADDVVDIRTGTMDLIFDPGEVPTLLFPVVTCVNGAHVVDDSSALAGRLGEQIADPRFTLIDDATDAFGFMAGAFDGEGTPARRTAVIERGVLTSYLTDLATASRLGTASTGHARRTLTQPPVPGASNVIVEPGERTAAELVADVKTGIRVLHTAGGSMGNLRGGELSATAAYALKVENGEIVGRVKDCIFGGNVFEMLKQRLRGISSDARRAHGHYLAPAVVIADQTITAKG